VPGLASACESLDDDDAAAAARAWTRQDAGLVEPCFGRLELFYGSRHGEQLARVRNVFGAIAAGEQPIVYGIRSCPHTTTPNTHRAANAELAVRSTDDVKLVDTIAATRPQST